MIYVTWSGMGNLFCIFLYKSVDMFSKFHHFMFSKYMCLRMSQYAVKAQTSLALLSRFRGSRVTTAHAHQCCIFQSYAKTVPSRMKLTMKLTMREPTFMGSMTTDT